MGLFWKLIVRIIRKAYFDQPTLLHTHTSLSKFTNVSKSLPVALISSYGSTAATVKNVKYLNSRAYFWYIKEAHYSS
jgi:hypothetical protein